MDKKRLEAFSDGVLAIVITIMALSLKQPIGDSWNDLQGITESSTKTAETLDMLEKGQIRLRTDFSFEEKALGTVSRLTGYAVRGLMVIALFIGSCLMCIASAIAGVSSTIGIVFLVLGLVGYGLGVFFAFRVYRNMKKGK